MKPRKLFSLISIHFLLLGFVGFAQAMYNPAMGSFLNRDPIEERGGENLYGFVRNDGVGKIDVLGLDLKINAQVEINSAHRMFAAYHADKLTKVVGFSLQFWDDAGNRKLVTPHLAAEAYVDPGIDVDEDGNIDGPAVVYRGGQFDRAAGGVGAGQTRTDRSVIDYAAIQLHVSGTEDDCRFHMVYEIKLTIKKDKQGAPVVESGSAVRNEDHSKAQKDYPATELSELIHAAPTRFMDWSSVVQIE